MNKTKQQIAFILACVLMATLSNVRGQTPVREAAKGSSDQRENLVAQTYRQKRPAFSLLTSSQAANASSFTFGVSPSAAGPNVTVLGSGTIGRLSKWTGFTSSNSFIGDSTIFEDKFGKVGIGTDTPASRLTVAGMIETTLGGYKFPDGTVQTTAALSSIFHDASLMGNGTSDSPLGIANGGVQTVHLANNAVTAAKIANGTVVRSLNGLFDNIQLAGGTNITITPAGNTLTIAAPNVLAGVTHDATLAGNGSTAMPLRVAVPLNLTGSVPFDFNALAAVIRVINTAAGGFGVLADGGDSNSDRGGDGVNALGGDSNSSFGGVGVAGTGGDSKSNFGGDGVSAIGGRSSSMKGGAGVVAIGGDSEDNLGGEGVLALGGESVGGTGGHGIVSVAGTGSGGTANGLAGQFNGNVQVTGNLSKGGGSFKIDHPLDPENKYLHHSFVESPDMKNIYDGNVTTDANGEATVQLPDWFEALNRDFRYQLTVIGTFAQAIVAEKIKGNRFVIKTSAPKVEVSWQVTGIRQDAFANKHRIPVEEAKPERERGYYLHPEAFDRPEERSVNWAQQPAMMQRLQQRRLAAQQARKQKPLDR